MKAFLDSISWGNVPQWGAFLVGFAALYFGPIRTLRRKVSDVEKIVNELKEQTTIFSNEHELNKKRFEHETKTNIYDIRPVFKKIKDNRFISQNQIQLIFKNYGTIATEIKIEGGAPIGATWSVFKYPSHEAPKDEVIDVMIQSNDPHFEGVTFDLTYYGEDDKKYTQTVAKKEGGNFQIEAPLL